MDRTRLPSRTATEGGSPFISRDVIAMPGLEERYPGTEIIYQRCPNTGTHRIVITRDGRSLSQKLFTAEDMARLTERYRVPLDTIFWEIIYSALEDAFPEDGTHPGKWVWEIDDRREKTNEEPPMTLAQFYRRRDLGKLKVDVIHDANPRLLVKARRDESLGGAHVFVFYEGVREAYRFISDDDIAGGASLKEIVEAMFVECAKAEERMKEAGGEHVYVDGLKQRYPGADVVVYRDPASYRQAIRVTLHGKLKAERILTPMDFIEAPDGGGKITFYRFIYETLEQVFPDDITPPENWGADGGAVSMDAGPWPFREIEVIKSRAPLLEL